MEEWVSERLSGCLGVPYNPNICIDSEYHNTNSIVDFLKAGELDFVGRDRVRQAVVSSNCSLKPLVMHFSHYLYG